MCVKSRLNIIICVDQNGGMGFKEKLPWKFPLEHAYFKQKIYHHSLFPGLQKNTLIMGRKTFIDFYKQDKDENLYENIYVLTSQVDFFQKRYKNVNFIPNLKFCIDDIIRNNNTLSDIWVIGGKQNYLEILNQYPELCGDIYLTEIEGIFESDLFIDFKKFPIQWENQITYKEVNEFDNKIYTLNVKKGKLKQT